MNRRLFQHSLLFITMSAALMCVVLSYPCRAQSVLHAQTREKLRTPVHLTTGATTLEHIMETLAQQTGLAMQAASYLNPHKLTLYIEAESAENVLNTLAEMNGWRWYETETNGIVLTRPRVRMPEKLTEIPAALKAAMPVDVWRYLGIDLDYMRSTPSSPPLTAPHAAPKPTRHAPSFMEMNQRILQQGDNLAHLLPANIRDGNPLPYAKLTPEQQRALLACLFLDDSLHLNGMMGNELMHGYFQPFELDIAKTDLTLTHGRFMHIGSTTVVGSGVYKTGFGAPIDYEARLHHPPPAPLFPTESATP